jgi:tRNA uridine 5-carboxymethylaminomethyl modification enzyme
LCPLYSGKIEGLGPRYCPSIEDKIFKFPDKRSHQIFIEPEGAWTDELYVNGFSTSFPLELQLPLIRSVVGCEKATIIRPAYAVEYDYVLPTQLKRSLETDVCSGLFLAGQINGTSGYEEAGAQGIIAGINAARFALEKPSIVLGRDQAYIGVLIDDLVSYGTSEPYRMFTSRAEYRLLLRQDNADFRLSKLGFDVGLLSANKYRAFEQRLSCFNDEMARLASTYHNGTPLDSLLRRPEVSYATLPKKNTALSEDVSNLVETEIKYAGYVERQRVEVERLASTEDKAFPAGFDFLSVSGLRTEARMKLTTVKPKTVGQARRISGVTPADISLLLVFLKRTSTSHT